MLDLYPYLKVKLLKPLVDVVVSMQNSHACVVFLMMSLVLLAACGGSEETPLPTQAEVPTAEPTVTLTPTAEGGAFVLPLGLSVQGQIEVGQIPDRWQLNIEQPLFIQLQLTRFSPDFNMQVQLIDPDGAVLNQFGTGEDNANLSPPVFLGTPGVYAIQVSGAGTGGQYALMVVEAPPTPEAPIAELATDIPTATQTLTFTPSFTPTFVATEAPPATETPVPTEVAILQEPGGRLELGESRRSEITQPGETHRYTFFSNAEDTVSIMVNPDPEQGASLNPRLEVQGPNGDIIAENDDMLPGVPDAYVRNFEVPSTGVYTMYITSADEVGIGQYWLSLSSEFTMRDVDRGEALHNLPNDQRLETYGARDVWIIPLNAGDVVSVAVIVTQPESDFDVMTELVAPTGDVWFDDDSGANNDAFLAEIVAPVDGIYRLHIAAQNNASIGDYQLWWQRTNDFPTPTPFTPTATTPPTDTPPSDTITDEVPPGASFVYQIRANALQDVNIVVQGQDGFDAVLRVIAPAGNILVEVDDVGNSRDPRTAFVAESSGLYRIEVFGFEGAGGRFILNYIVQ
jgi:hypothetical protein